MPPSRVEFCLLGHHLLLSYFLSALSIFMHLTDTICCTRITCTSAVTHLTCTNYCHAFGFLFWAWRAAAHDLISRVSVMKRKGKLKGGRELSCSRLLYLASLLLLPRWSELSTLCCANPDLVDYFFWARCYLKQIRTSGLIIKKDKRWIISTISTVCGSTVKYSTRCVYINIE